MLVAVEFEERQQLFETAIARTKRPASFPGFSLGKGIQNLELPHFQSGDPHGAAVIDRIGTRIQPQRTAIPSFVIALLLPPSTLK